MVLSRHIKSTTLFKQSNHVIQRSLLSKTNHIAIRNSFNKVMEIGFDKWSGNSKASINNKNIIKELIKKQALKW